MHLNQKSRRVSRQSANALKTRGIKTGERFNACDERFAAAEAKADARYNAADAKIDAKWAQMDQRFMAVMAQHRRDFLWLLGFQIAIATGLLTAMARGFHWL